MGRHSKRTSFSKGSRLAVAGFAIAGATAALAPAASAATDSDWDRLAQCESGGNWQINTGNGYHGGLQFSPSTWSGYGGGEFAPTANQATREQQIVVAERVLAGQGWGARPSCSAQLGLNSPATPREAPAAPAPAPAPVAKAAEAEVASQTTVEGLDAAFQRVVGEIEAQGFAVPNEVHDAYASQRDNIANFIDENQRVVQDFIVENQGTIDQLTALLPR